MNTHPTLYENLGTGSILESSSNANPEYPLYLVISTDEYGVISAVVANLPGAGGCGDTEDEAIEGAKESALDLIEEHQNSNEAIGWIDVANLKIGNDERLKVVVATHA